MFGFVNRRTMSAPKLTPFELEALSLLKSIKTELEGIQQATREVVAEIRQRCGPCK